MSQEIEPIWGIEANIAHTSLTGEGKTIVRRGTGKFHGGAKVYIAGAYWGPGGEDLVIVGRYRGKRLITCAIKAYFLENIRTSSSIIPK